MNRYLKNRDRFTKGKLVFAGIRDTDSQDGVHLRPRASEDVANVIDGIIDQEFAQ